VTAGKLKTSSKTTPAFMLNQVLDSKATKIKWERKVEKRSKM